MQAERLADEQLEGAFGGFEFVAFVFEILDRREDAGDFVRAFLEIESEFLRFHEDVALAGQIGDDGDALVSDGHWVDVLVAAREFLHGVDVLPAFVGEGGGADERRADVVRDVREFVDEEGELAQFHEVGDDGDAELELEIRDDGDEVAVSDAFTVAIDRALHLHGPRAHGGECVGDSDAGVVVRVDADAGAEHGHDFAGDFLDFIGQAAAVRVAQNDEVRAGIARGGDGAQRVIVIRFERVEKMLGIVEHFAPVFFQIRDCVGDHREVFLERDAEDFGDVQRGSFPDDADHRRLRVEQQLYLRIFFHGDFAASRRAKCGDLCVLPRVFFRKLEKLRVLWIRAGEAAFDVVDAEFIEPFRHANLVRHRERNAGPLRAIAKGRVVEGECWRFHKMRAVLVIQMRGRGKRCAGARLLKIVPDAPVSTRRVCSASLSSSRR